MLKKYLTVAGKLCACLLMLCLSLWGGGALWFQAALVVAVAWGVASGATLVWWWRRRSARVLLPWALAVALMMGWWSTIQPSQDRVWADDVARMVTGRVQGSVVTLDQVRNFDWRSDADYTQRWEQRSYDLKQLQSVDVALSY